MIYERTWPSQVNFLIQILCAPYMFSHKNIRKQPYLCLCRSFKDIVIYLAWELQFQKLFWVGHLINVSLKSKYKSSISNIWDICMPEYNWMNWCFYIHRQLPQFQVTSNDIIYIFIIAILGGTQNLFFSFFLKIEARLFIIKFCTEQNKILHFHKTIWIIYTKGLRVISY